MNERHLRVFLAVLDAGGVTNAARQLRLAQPSVSQALRGAERECGFELFHRIGRGLRVTPAGEAMVEPARQALRSLETLVNAAAEVNGLVRGRLDIGALSTLARDPLAGLIGQFRQTHDNISVRVLESEGTAALTGLLRDGSCEIGIAHLPLPTATIVTRTLGQQELLFVLPPGSDASVWSLRTSAMASIPLVVSPPGTSMRIMLEQALAAVGVEPLIAVETAAREATVPLVLAGAGAALLPAPIAWDAGRLGAVVRTPSPAITRQIGLIHRDERLSPAGQAFLLHAMAATDVAEA